MYDIKNVAHVESRLAEVVKCLRSIGVEATYHLGMDEHYEIVCKYKGKEFRSKLPIHGTSLSLWGPVDFDVSCSLAQLVGMKFKIDRGEIII